MHAYTASMKAIVARRVSRTILLAFPLALLACEWPSGNDLSGRVGDPLDAEQSASVTDDSLEVEVSDFARQAQARMLVDDQYETIRDWLRQHDLRHLNHSDLVSMAETDAAAARYIECHEGSISPTGTDTRLGLLSACLTEDPNAKARSATVPPSIAVADETAEQQESRLHATE